MNLMTTLINIKRVLSGNPYGKFFLKAYHYILAVPLTKIYALKFNFIKHKIKKVNFYNNKETFDLINSYKKSLCRFGDGEISWIYRDSRGYFSQENSKELSDRLREIIFSNDDRILIGVPNFFGELNGFSRKRKNSRNAHLGKYYNRWNELLETDKKYADALITRVYNGLENNCTSPLFNDWRKIWEDKHIIVVEGSQTRFGVGNDLLDNATSIKRIIAPSENAFKKYNEIYGVVKNYINKETLFLISLGPTATILAYDIGKMGGQAIDIGHLDIEYEWYLSGATKKEPVQGKYVNEAGGAYTLELPKKTHEKYKLEIIDKI
ncbi:DUF1792 domain-containing protein [Bacillus sp. SB49]|uniref:GT-D fold domain-containing glycosyltransferase n=1 Tax=Bacillus sp. SB49 TaxID=1071080 RepID=UPI00041F50B8|nr:GT-D fold domain-containing glycosyltransferase [Bacillus sp. SB49]QHT48023.1 DUF1792 domain-containing protein [Bacillus sp. SB49]